MLTEFGPDLYLADGPTVSFYGFPYPTRMAVVRLSSNETWVWSPIELTQDLADAVEAVGPVTHIVSPNKLHHLALATGWKGMLLRLDDLVGPHGSTPREWRLSFLSRDAARAARQRVLDWKPERLLIAHGECVDSGATHVIAQALRWI